MHVLPYAKRAAYFRKSIATDMGGVPRYSSQNERGKHTTPKSRNSKYQKTLLLRDFFSKTSRVLLHVFVRHEAGTQQKLFRKTCSDELSYIAGNFGGDSSSSESIGVRGRFHSPEKICSHLIGVCAMTTEFLDSKICIFKILLSWRFPRKTAFWTISSLPPRPPPPQKRKILFIVVSPSLI